MIRKKEFFHDGLTAQDLEHTRVYRLTVKYVTHTDIHYFEAFNVMLISTLITVGDEPYVKSIKIDKV